MANFPIPLAPDVNRLTVLATEFRRARATSSGLAEDLHEMRQQANNLRRRILLTNARGEGNGPVEAQIASQHVAEIEPQLESLVARIAEVEGEQREAAGASSVAKTTLSAAVEAARNYKLAIPAEIEGMLQ